MAPPAHADESDPVVLAARSAGRALRGLRRAYAGVPSHEAAFWLAQIESDFTPARAVYRRLERIQLPTPLAATVGRTPSIVEYRAAGTSPGARIHPTGPAGAGPPEVSVCVKAELAHALLLGKLDVPSLILAGQVTLAGPFPAVFGYVSLAPDIAEIYATPRSRPETRLGYLRLLALPAGAVDTIAGRPPLDRSAASQADLVAVLLAGLPDSCRAVCLGQILRLSERNLIPPDHVRHLVARILNVAAASQPATLEKTAVSEPGRGGAGQLDRLRTRASQVGIDVTIQQAVSSRPQGQRGALESAPPHAVQLRIHPDAVGQVQGGPASLAAHLAAGRVAVVGRTEDCLIVLHLLAAGHTKSIKGRPVSVWDQCSKARPVLNDVLTDSAFAAGAILAALPARSRVAELDRLWEALRPGGPLYREGLSRLALGLLEVATHSTRVA